MVLTEILGNQRLFSAHTGEIISLNWKNFSLWRIISFVRCTQRDWILTKVDEKTGVYEHESRRIAERMERFVQPFIQECIRRERLMNRNQVYQGKYRYPHYSQSISKRDTEQRPRIRAIQLLPLDITSK